MAGWIKISKEINSHWIWKDPIKFQWWIDILLTVNYSDTKVPIGFKVFECKRGETLLSLLSWSKRWGVSKSVVNNFFKMLENDNMIETVNETVTTRLIVCNYDTYQQFENANETEIKRKRNAKETQCDTIKEVIKNKEENKEIILNWRENFDLYLKELNAETIKLLNDKEWFLEREKFHPNLDIRLTIEKAYKDFWSKDVGWKNKKSNKKTINIDWKATYNNAISQKINQVYKQKYEKGENDHVH